jgi:hypothetical protein
MEGNLLEAVFNGTEAVSAACRARVTAQTHLQDAANHLENTKMKHQV